MAKKGDYKSPETKNRLIQSLLNGATVTAACKAAGINRDSFYRWYNSNEDFQKQVDDAKLAQVSVVEDSLFSKAKRGHTAAMIFFLCNRAPGKWKNVQKTEVELNAPLPINFVPHPGKHDSEPGRSA